MICKANFLLLASVRMLQISDEIRTLIPFDAADEKKEDEFCTELASTDAALQRVFEDRMEIFSLINESIQEVICPTPTYTKSLEPYLSLEYNYDDLIAINSIVDGEVNQDIPSIQDVDGLLATHTQNVAKKQHMMFQKYGIDADDFFRKQSMLFKHSSPEEGDESGTDSDSDPRPSSSRMATTYTTSLASVAGAKRKMSVEEFHQKIVWERWSGNGSTLHSPSVGGVETDLLLHAHSPAAGGFNVSMALKPPAWHNRDVDWEKEKKKDRDRDTKHGDVGQLPQHVLTFDDFMRSIPMFHALSQKEFEFIEQNSSVVSFNDQELIVSEGQRADTVFVVREGVVKRVKARSNPTLVRRGDIFGDSAVTEQASQATYISSGSTLLICIPPKIFNAILHSSESDLNISNAGVVLEDSILSNHVEKFLDVLNLFQENENAGTPNERAGKGHRASKSMGRGAASKQRFSTFNLSKQQFRSNVHKEGESYSDKEESEGQGLHDNHSPPPSASRPHRGAPRVSQVFAHQGEESDERSVASEGSSSSSSESDAELFSEELDTRESTKLDKPMVQPISTRGSKSTRRGSSVLSFNATGFLSTRNTGTEEEKDKDRGTGGPSGLPDLGTKTSMSAISCSMQGGENFDFDAVNRKLLLELQASSSPELSFGDTVEHMVRLTREFFAVDRVGFFIVDKEKGILYLKVTQEGAGLKIALKGIAGHIARTGQTVNIEDAYLDDRFDPTMDMNTGYRTKQMLCVPVCDYPGNVAGVLQLINTESDISFQDDDVTLAEIVATQIGDMMYSMSSRLSNIEYTPIYKVRTPLRIRLGHVLFTRKHNHLKCTVQVVHGGVKLGQVTTELVEAVSMDGTGVGGGIKRCTFDRWLEFGEMIIGDLPQACRVIFQFYSKNNHAVGWCGMTLFTYDHHLKTGDVELNLWDDECPSPNVPALQNIESGRVMTLEFPGFELPILYEIAEINYTPGSNSNLREKTLQQHLDKMREESRRRFLSVLNDPIASMTTEDKDTVWRLRYSLMSEPAYLPKFLLAVDWFSSEAVTEAYHMLYKWEIPHYVQALQMLDSHYPDPRVRAYAVQLLGTLTDDELCGFMLQLTQLLKFEPFHDSGLARFLLRRALTNPEKVGHTFFWYLKAEMHVKEVKQRFGLLLKLYMRTCGEYRTALGHQLLVMRRLEEVARHVQACSTKEERLTILRERIAQTDFPSCFQLPLNPNIKAKGIIAHKCRVMESKKKPLWLTFENADPEGKPIVVMFKAGDDLRQDQLTLQVLSVMDKLWKKEDMDMKMSAYGCISTGDEIGMLEVVLDSSTLASIVAASRREVYNGNGRKIMAALDALYSNDVLQNWLVCSNVDSLQSQRTDPPLFDHQGNPRPPRRNALSGPPSLPTREGGKSFSCPIGGLETAKENFLRSCAGYCVATFVMGIGDRHNDNIMMKRTGELFHIDFGHFLGNFKWKYGIKRERAPFVFTPAFAAVLDGEGSPTYERFVDLAVRAFNVLRRNSSLLVTLFSLMVSCGIPELQREEDIAYLRDNLMSGESDEVAAGRLREIIQQCLHTRTTQLNDAVHLLVHA